MRITSSFNGLASVLEIDKDEALIGRPSPTGLPDIDLSADITVSRKHARIWRQADGFWVEDFNSKYGTLVNGVKITYQRQLHPGDVIRIGETTLQVEIPPPLFNATVTSDDNTPTVHISTIIDANAPTLIPVATADTEIKNRLSLLFDLPLQFGAQARLEELLPIIIQRVVEVLPGAERGALLLWDRRHDKLLLKAHVGSDEPSVSQTLAKRAMSEGRGFIWRRGLDGDSGESMRRLQIESGMYAPLLWKGQALGVLCVDNPHRDSAFSEEDLRFMLAIAHYAAMAVMNHQLQDELKQNAKVLERLLTNFSPKIREKIIEKNRLGRLRPGGEKSEVTILFSDMRGFTKTCAGLDTEDIVDMLYDYFSVLVEAIFKHDGTIDKFVGDAVLAIFGSPEPDSHQHEKAVQAALAMQAATTELNTRRAARGEAVCEIGIGVHCGEVFHGFIGAADRMEFTVIGDAVNRASRYCNGAKAGEVLISPDVYQRVFRLVQSEKLMIPTKHEGDIGAYRVKGLKA